MSLETNKLEFKAVEGIPGAFSYHPCFAYSGDKTFLKNGKNSSVIYEQVKEISPGKYKYECTTCNSEIKKVTVHHQISDGLFPCSGDGRMTEEDVPYCPVCEEVPNPCGCPVEATALSDY